MKHIDWSRIEHFRPDEFSCHCCGQNEIKRELVIELEGLRKELGHPITVTSGYRCPKYNDQISSTGFDGPHTTGMAADISVAFDLWRKVVGLIPHRFNGLGYKLHGAGRFIHLDMLRKRTWTYP